MAKKQSKLKWYDFAQSRSKLIKLFAIVAAIVVGGYFIIASHAESVVYAAPATIASDCSRDVTAELNNFFNSVPNGTEANPSVMTLKIGGCYRTDGVLYLTNKSNVVLDGNTATIDAHYTQTLDTQLPGPGRNLMIEGGNYVTVQDLGILGECKPDPVTFCQKGYANYEHGHAIGIITRDGMQPKNITIQRNYIRNTWGDAVYISQKGGDALATRPDHITIQDNLFIVTGRQGVAPSGATNSVIRRNRMFYVAHSALDFESEGGGVANITVEDNEIIKPNGATLNANCSSHGTDGFANKGPIYLTDNHIYGTRMVVNTVCDGKNSTGGSLPAGTVVVTGNEDNLPGEPSKQLPYDSTTTVDKPNDPGTGGVGSGGGKDNPGGGQPKPGPTGLAVPRNLKAAANSKKDIDLTWNTVSGAVKYRVYRNNKLIKEVKQPAFTDKKAEAGVNYTYRVRAVDSSNKESKPSVPARLRINL